MSAAQALAPGQWVRLAGAPEWGPGQVQSVVGERVTVNFQHGGKRLVRTDVAALERIPAPRESP